jgi:hypothetical protein
MQTHPAVAAIPAAGGNPAVPAQFAGGYQTVQAMRDGYLAHFQLESFAVVAQAKMQALKCESAKDVRGFTVKFNMLTPDALHGLDDTGLQHAYHTRLPTDIHSEMIRTVYPKANMLTLQEAAIHYARALVATQKRSSLKRTMEDTTEREQGDTGGRGRGRGRERTYGRGGRMGNHSNDKRRKADEKTTDRGTPPRPCKHCGAMHWDSDCDKQKKPTGKTTESGNGKDKSKRKKDKDSKNATSVTLADGTIKTKAELFAKGLCFKCGKAGHLIADCNA